MHAFKIILLYQFYARVSLRRKMSELAKLRSTTKLLMLFRKCDPFISVDQTFIVYPMVIDASSTGLVFENTDTANIVFYSQQHS